MPGRGGRRNSRADEDSRPLLVSSREDLSTTLTLASSENVLFSVEGDEDEHETSALEDTHRRSKADQTVRFEEHVQVIAPPLRSTPERREVGMYCIVIVIVFRVARLFLFIDIGQLCDRNIIEFDLDDDTVAQTNFDHDIRPSDPNREQSMPLLVGLLDASAVRRSPDIPMGVDYAPECSDVDLEEVVAKQSAGGGMLSSVANMANSILGAGAFPYPLPIAMADIGPFKGLLVYHSIMLRYSYNSEHFHQVYPTP
jgi:sodium-coupled neutral amino acid transporter 11